MSSNAFTAMAALCGLTAGGIGLNCVVLPPAPASAVDRAMLRAAADQDLAAFALGGFRVLAADIAWLQMWSQWERHDWPATEARIRLACALEPRSLYFWLNGARIMAYDAAGWNSDAAVGRQLRRTQAEAALEFLRAVEPFHGDDPRLWIERAGLELYGRGDRAAAASCYRHAAELPGCPAFAGRLHAKLLQGLGRSAEALAWLVQWQPTLRGENADVVVERIRELEHELGVRSGKSYPAARQSVESAAVPAFR